MRQPMLDPDRGLKGATPEELARALLRGENVKASQETNKHDEAKSCTKP